MKKDDPLHVSVTTLAGFACRVGDLMRDGVAGPTAMEGMQAHKRLQKELLATGGEHGEIEAEVMLACDCTIEGREVSLSGRLDLLDRKACQLGEIKTTLVPAEQLSNAQKELQWSQLYLYGFIFWQQCKLTGRDINELELSLIHVNLRAKNKQTEKRQASGAQLKEHADRALKTYVVWMGKVEHSNRLLVESGTALAFPFDSFRGGQRNMAAAVYRASRDADTLMCEAPTGIGKTISSLYPIVKSLAEGHVKQTAYLTAKVAGRVSAMRALMQLRDAGLKITAIQIRAKQSSCFCSNGRCERDEEGRCPMTLGFYDRLPAARDELLGLGVVSSDAFDDIAWNHQLCPFELTQQMLAWMHVVVADYNYVFDPLVRLPHFSVSGKETVLLIDEAHNLVDRSRHMFSAVLSRAQCLDESHSCWQTHPAMAKALDQLSAELLTVAGQCSGESTVLVSPDSALLRRVSRAVELMFEALAQPPVLSTRESIDLFRALCRFAAIGDLFSEHHRCIVEIAKLGRRKEVRVELYCLDASAALTSQYKSYRSIVLFSATLCPSVFYRDALGLPVSTKLLQLDSPFNNDNACQAVVGWIDTRFRQRQASLSDLIDLIGQVTVHKAGNYLVFFPSYAYLEQAHKLFAATFSEVETWAQDRSQSKSDQGRQLEHLSNAGHRIGFAIQGGVFGEGIDYLGDLLIGVIVVGTGLSGIDSKTRLVADHYRLQGHDGFDFTYRYPGFTRVLQTAGRLIRDEDDRGIILLVDSRFAQSAYRALYPSHWKMRWPRDVDALNNEISEFWKQHDN